MRCEDNGALERCANAGQKEGGTLIMHNGLRLKPSSLGSWCLCEVAKANRGVLEPQHERAFAELLRIMGPSPLILDVGARSGYYALWMKRLRPGSRCVVVEPDKGHLRSAQKNFELNQLQGQFFQAYIGSSCNRLVDGVQVLTIEEIARRLKTDYIDLLHADVGGYELELLQGTAPIFKDRGVNYLLISTHAKALHEECRAFLEAQRYVILADVNLPQSCVEDGLLVARRKELVGLEKIPLSSSCRQV